MTRRKLHEIKFGIQTVVAVRIGGVAFIAISSSLRVRTLAADIHFGLPVWPPHICLLAGVAPLRFGHMRVQACVPRSADYRKEDYARDSP